jgi:hypothetical protein
MSEDISIPLILLVDAISFNRSTGYFYLKQRKGCDAEVKRIPLIKSDPSMILVNGSSATQKY